MRVSFCAQRRSSRTCNNHTWAAPHRSRSTHSNDGNNYCSIWLSIPHTSLQGESTHTHSLYLRLKSQSWVGSGWAISYFLLPASRSQGAQGSCAVVPVAYTQRAADAPPVAANAHLIGKKNTHKLVGAGQGAYFLSAALLHALSKYTRAAASFPQLQRTGWTCTADSMHTNFRVGKMHKFL